MNTKQRRHLRALAHHLDPVVTIGQAGMSTAVVNKVNVELENHELIKVRVLRDAPISARAAGEDLAQETGAYLAQVIGRIAVLYKARAKKPTIKLPQ